MLTHPKIAAMDCDDCEKWIHINGEFELRGGNRIPRNGAVTPCRSCPKIPEETLRVKRTVSRNDAIEITAENRKAYQYYRECKAVGNFPDDPIVRRDAALIAEIEKAVDYYWQQKMFRLVSRIE